MNNMGVKCSVTDCAHNVNGCACRLDTISVTTDREAATNCADFDQNH